MIEKDFKELILRYPVLSDCVEQISFAYKILIDCFQNEQKLLVCGNGGSASDSEHIAGELLKSFRFKRSISDLTFKENFKRYYKRDVPEYLEDGFPVIPLTSQSVFTSAFCNDANPVGVFAQQVYVYGQKNDVLLILSTSGNSLNCVEAAKVAKANSLKVIAMTGAKKSKLYKIADVTIMVPKILTHEVQELHLPIYHAICAAIERELCYEK